MKRSFWLGNGNTRCFENDCSYNVEQDLVVIDLDDGTFDQITIIEVLDGGIDCLDAAAPLRLAA